MSCLIGVILALSTRASEEWIGSDIADVAAVPCSHSCPEEIVKRWLRRLVLGIAGLLVLAVLVGAGYETAGRRRARQDFPPAGRLVDIGGRRMQIDCRGSGAPTVVFESGLDIFGSLAWSAVHDSVAHTTRACAYSRAGVMWSERAPGRRAATEVADDLHATLVAAGERAPYVMVAHSLGGPFVMTYTRKHGGDVAGLVFVDASHPDQVSRLRAAGMTSVADAMRPLRLVALFAPLGIPRLIAGRDSGMPNEPPAAVRAAAAYMPLSLPAALAEADAIDTSFAEAGSLRTLGDRPLVVLTAMAPMSAEERAAMKMTPAQARQAQDVWKSLQDEEASWSSHSRHQLVPDSHHYIQFERPDIVIAAVREVVDTVRARPSAAGTAVTGP